LARRGEQKKKGSGSPEAFGGRAPKMNMIQKKKKSEP